MAIDKVYVLQNDSIIPDELLSHRLGLIPIKVRPELFTSMEKGAEANFDNTLVFRLDVQCPSKKKRAEPEESTTLTEDHGEGQSSLLLAVLPTLARCHYIPPALQTRARGVPATLVDAHLPFFVYHSWRG